MSPMKTHVWETKEIATAVGSLLVEPKYKFFLQHTVWSIAFNIRTPCLTTNEILRQYIMKIEDFFRCRVKKTMVLFRGRSLIFVKFFMCRPILLRSRPTFVSNRPILFKGRPIFFSG